MTETVELVPSAELDSRIRILRCGDTVDTFAVVTERFLVLLDTMVSPETMTAAMELLQPDLAGGRQLVVANTHGDWDHVWGNGIFNGPNAAYPAPVLGSHRTAGVMSSTGAADLLARFQLEQPGLYDNAAYHPPTLRFEGTFTIDGGDLTIQLIPLPGHTPDHSIQWIPELRYLFAADGAEVPMPFIHGPESVPILRRSLRTMLDMNPERVLYCHAPGVTESWVIEENIRYFDQMERLCREVLAASPDLDPDALEAPEAVIGWPLAGALPAGMTEEDLTQPDFYLQAHRKDIRAMLGWLKLGAADASQEVVP